jgi:hypothetical protein
MDVQIIVWLKMGFCATLIRMVDLLAFSSKTFK